MRQPELDRPLILQAAMRSLLTIVPPPSFNHNFCFGKIIKPHALDYLLKRLSAGVCGSPSARRPSVWAREGRGRASRRSEARIAFSSLLFLKQQNSQLLNFY